MALKLPKNGHCSTLFVIIDPYLTLFNNTGHYITFKKIFVSLSKQLFDLVPKQISNVVERSRASYLIGILVMLKVIGSKHRL